MFVVRIEFEFVNMIVLVIIFLFFNVSVIKIMIRIVNEYMVIGVCRFLLILGISCIIIMGINIFKVFVVLRCYVLLFCSIWSLEMIFFVFGLVWRKWMMYKMCVIRKFDRLNRKDVLLFYVRKVLFVEFRVKVFINRVGLLWR